MELNEYIGGVLIKFDVIKFTVIDVISWYGINKIDMKNE